jgi:hypothetical protein
MSEQIIFNVKVTCVVRTYGVFGEGLGFSDPTPPCSPVTSSSDRLVPHAGKERQVSLPRCILRRYNVHSRRPSTFSHLANTASVRGTSAPFVPITNTASVKVSTGPFVLLPIHRRSEVTIYLKSFCQLSIIRVTGIYHLANRYTISQK